MTRYVLFASGVLALSSAAAHAQSSASDLIAVVEAPQTPNHQGLDPLTLVGGGPVRLLPLWGPVPVPDVLAPAPRPPAGSPPLRPAWAGWKPLVRAGWGP